MWDGKAAYRPMCMVYQFHSPARSNKYSLLFTDPASISWHWKFHLVNELPWYLCMWKLLAISVWSSTNSPQSRQLVPRSFVFMRLSCLDKSKMTTRKLNDLQTRFLIPHVTTTNDGSYDAMIFFLDLAPFERRWREEFPHSALEVCIETDPYQPGDSDIQYFGDQETAATLCHIWGTKRAERIREHGGLIPSIFYSYILEMGKTPQPDPVSCILYLSLIYSQKDITN